MIEKLPNELTRLVNLVTLLIHKVTTQDLLLEEIGLILLGLLRDFSHGLLHGRNRCGTLVGLTASHLGGDGSTDGRGPLGAVTQRLGPIEAFAWAARWVRSLFQRGS